MTASAPPEDEATVPPTDQPDERNRPPSEANQHRRDDVDRQADNKVKYTVNEGLRLHNRAYVAHARQAKTEGYGWERSLST